MTNEIRDEAEFIAFTKKWIPKGDDFIIPPGIMSDTHQNYKLKIKLATIKPLPSELYCYPYRANMSRAVTLTFNNRDLDINLGMDPFETFTKMDKYIKNAEKAKELMEATQKAFEVEMEMKKYNYKQWLLDLVTSVYHPSSITGPSNIYTMVKKDTKWEDCNIVIRTAMYNTTVFLTEYCHGRFIKEKFLSKDFKFDDYNDCDYYYMTMLQNYMRRNPNIPYDPDAGIHHVNLKTDGDHICRLIKDFQTISCEIADRKREEEREFKKIKLNEDDK